MESGDINEVGNKAPEKQLSPEYLKQTAQKLTVTIHDLMRLKNPENKEVISSKKGVYQWGYKEYRTDPTNNGITNVELTEHILKNNIRKDIMLGPNLISVAIRNFKDGTRKTYTNTPRALNGVKEVMGHLSDNIEPTTA